MTPQRMIADMPIRAGVPWGRYLASVVAGVVLLAIVISTVTNERFHWPVVGEYLFHPDVIAGVGMTVLLTVVVMVVSIVLGTLVALMRMSSITMIKGIAGAYITVFRSIPMLALILLFYNIAALYPRLSIGVPGAEPVWSMSTNDIVTPWVAAITALVLHETAYTAETVRAGLLAVPGGQQEAGLALGLNAQQTFMKVTLPQAMRIIVPPMANLAIALMKATSLVSVIAVSDLLHSVRLIYANNYETIPLLFVAIIWYFVLTTVLSFGQGVLERKLSQSPRALVRPQARMEVEVTA